MVLFVDHSIMLGRWSSGYDTPSMKKVVDAALT